MCEIYFTNRNTDWKIFESQIAKLYRIHLLYFQLKRFYELKQVVTNITHIVNICKLIISKQN